MSERGHWLWPSVLVCLPVVALTVGGVYFLVSELPGFVRSRKAAVTLAYKELAAEVLAEPRPDDWQGVRPDGWYAASSRLPAADGESVNWGHGEWPGGELVWVSAPAPEMNPAGERLRKRERRRWARGRVVEPIGVVGLEVWLYAGGTFSLLAMWALTVFGIYYFRRYNREREDFFRAAAHDLVTPLAGLKGMIGVDDELAQQLVDRMFALTDNLRLFLRMGSRRKAPALTELDLVAIYDEAYRIFAADFADSVSGPVVKTGAAELVATGEATMVLQAFWNLLGNALKYAAPYGPVEVRFGERGGMAVVELADQGLGMTKRQRRHAFRRYYRAMTAKASGQHGFGIGLATARELVRAMGGELAVTANSPRGSVFVLTLPRKAVK